MSNTWWRDVDELAKEQSDLLDLPAESNLLIKGPPGSGKTNLLLLRANQLYLGDYPNLFVVVFGSLLKNFIQIGGSQYKFPSDKIITHTSLFRSILQSEGADFDDKAMDITEARQKRADLVEGLLAAGRIGAQFDALLLDEAQDYTSQEIRLLRRLTNILVATADTRQRIYDVDDCTEALSNCTDSEYTLKYHFRNGLDICRVADGINKGYPGYVPILPHSNYPEAEYPSKATPKNGLTLDEQIDAIAAQIKDQRFAYPDDLIGVLTPRNEELNQIQAGLIKAGLGEQITRANASNQFDPTRPIWLSTLTAAKGLEFRALHIAGLDYLSRTGGVQKRLIFTGVTRAKTALTLYWHQSVPGYLESACRIVGPSQPVLDKKSLFGN
ncbi:ATP-binding domain-containing protein [Pseudomonas aeruginosa]|uniref:ATP-binding domain-containing protein n=1 Tax=Pseudomonas aeruginosa TaxID=287 RepID=UPI003D9CA91D